MEPSVSNSVMLPLEGADGLGEKLVEIPTRGFSQLWKTVRYGRRFLLKGLKPDYRQKAEFQALLRKEFELAMRLDHPGVVRVWGLEENAVAGLCIVMEYIEGDTLKSLMDQGVADEAVCRGIALRLVDAVAYIHESGVSHRDLKPDNVMVARRDRRPVLIDFGLGDSDDYVILKPSSATRSYGAPEQLDGSQGDERSDIYSLGRILTELSLPAEWSGVIGRCLAAEPSERPTAAEILAVMRESRQRRRKWIPYAAGTAIAVAGLLTSFLIRREAGISDVAGGAAVRDTVVEVRTVHDTVHDTVYVAASEDASVRAAVPPVSVQTSPAAAGGAGSSSGGVDALYEAMWAEARPIVVSCKKEYEAVTDVMEGMALIEARDKKLRALLDRFMSSPEVASLPQSARDKYEYAFWFKVAQVVSGQ